MTENKGRGYEVITFPYEETTAIIKILEKAEKSKDLKTLMWSARRLLWLYNAFKDETSFTDEPFQTETAVKCFNMAWEQMLKNDPLPEAAAEGAI